MVSTGPVTVPPGSSGKPHDVLRCASCGTALWSKYHAAPGDTLLVRGGTLEVGTDDKSLRDAQWQPLEALAELEMYPPIGAELLACCREDGTGPVRVLGNTWRPYQG